MRKAKRLAAIVGVIGGLLWFLSALHFPPSTTPWGSDPYHLKSCLWGFSFPLWELWEEY
ncbi:hypothetical protein M1N13_03875 [Dehalococcoidia bacterium]|nr:hypothetical protein [Dehalococcoidia bacterium]